MYRYFLSKDRDSIPSGLPSRLVDPTLRVLGEQPQFLRIGEGNHPRNELLRVVKQYSSKDEVRANVLKDVFALNPKDKFDILSQPNNAYALLRASKDLGIPLETIGLSVDPNSNSWRLTGSLSTNATSLSNARTLIGRVASTQAKAGNPYIYNQLKKKQAFFAQPTIYSELAVDGTEGVEAIYEAFNKAEPWRFANSQGNRPILVQADGLNANANMKSGSPENIPPDDIEGIRGANRYVDVSQGLETARVIEYPNIYDRLNKGAQPIVTPTIPYSADIPTAVGDSILSPKVSIETKRPRFIDEGIGIYTRSGEPINAEQKNLLDTGMADLEDRSFILKDPIDLARQPARAFASRLPTNYFGVARDIPTDLRAEYGRTGRRGLTPTRDELPLTREIGFVIGSKLNREQYRPTSRLGLEVIGLNADRALDPVVIPSKELWGTTVVPEKRIGLRVATPINRLTDDLSNRVLSGEVDLRNYEPFKSNNTPQYYLDQSKDFVGPIRGIKNTTYGATQRKTPWREYYSDPFVYEDKGLDGEVNRLMRAVNEAPAQLENAYIQQDLANRRAIESTEKLRMLGSQVPVRYGLLPQGEGVVNLAREVRKDRRMAEIDAAKAMDTISQLKAAQELMGFEYMVKPKMFSPEVLKGYRIASRVKGAIKNSYINDYPSGGILDPVGYENAMVDMGYVGSRAEPDRDYDIASLFGFTGNY